MDGAKHRVADNYCLSTRSTVYWWAIGIVVDSAACLAAVSVVNRAARCDCFDHTHTRF